MADPVSSVTYAIESTLRALDGDLEDLLPSMAAIVAIIAVISATYHQLVGRFPAGGGGPRGVAATFGDGWAFIPLGALLVDFTLTVAVSCAAGASALIAYLPDLEPLRTPIGLALVALVAGGVLLGQLGRVAFALATQPFIVLAITVIVAGALADPAAAGPDQAARARQCSPMLPSGPCSSPFRSGWHSPPASKRPPMRSPSCRNSTTGRDGGSAAGRCG
jgi:hypothetical protein